MFPDSEDIQIGLVCQLCRRQDLFQALAGLIFFPRRGSRRSSPSVITPVSTPFIF
jgi:hypothetical protein